MSNFLGCFFHFLGGKKNLKFFRKYFSNRIEKLHKMAFIFFFFIEKVWKSWKNWFFRANTQILKSECTT